MKIDLFKIILIETHNTCSRRCWFCKFGQVRQDSSEQLMEWSVIERIVWNLAELKYNGRISWFWINEPLMDKRIVDIIKLTKIHCPNSFQSLVTNGDFLDVSLYRELRSEGLDALGVSVYDDRTSKRLNRIPRDGRLVIFDMRNIGPERLENRAGSIKNKTEIFETDRQRYVHDSCARPYKMITVNVKGQVVLCCADMYSEVVMGDVKNQRLEEIWRNASFTKYRRLLNNEGRENLDLCRQCSHDGTCNTSLYPLQTKSGDFLKTVVW